MQPFLLLTLVVLKHLLEGAFLTLAWRVYLVFQLHLKCYLASEAEGRWIQLERQTSLSHSIESEKVNVLLLKLLVSLLGRLLRLHWGRLVHWLRLRN